LGERRGRSAERELLLAPLFIGARLVVRGTANTSFCSRNNPHVLLFINVTGHTDIYPVPDGKVESLAPPGRNFFCPQLTGHFYRAMPRSARLCYGKSVRPSVSVCDVGVP